MAVEIRVPDLLQKLAGGSKVIKGEGKTVGQLLDYLDKRYPGFKSRVETPENKLHPFINVYLNDEDIRFLGDLATPLSDGDVIAILPAIVGGKKEMERVHPEWDHRERGTLWQR